MEEKQLSPQNDEASYPHSSQRPCPSSPPPNSQQLSSLDAERNANDVCTSNHPTLTLNTTTTLISSPVTRFRYTTSTSGTPISPSPLLSHQTKPSRPSSSSSTASSATLIGLPSRHPSPDPQSKTKIKFMANRTPYAHPQERPLIDYVTNDWKRFQDVDASDEDEAFYAKEEDEHWVHPKWKHLVAQSQNRVPRRLQRYALIYLVLLLVTWIAWRTYFGPNWTQYRMEQRKMDFVPKAPFGSNMRPEFSDMVQVKQMDSRLLPMGEASKTKRLVVVGDVHGCREELEDLLKKVDFNENHDHLILTGDIINKGPDSSGVVSLAQSLSASCVRGNHEDRTLLSLSDMLAHHVQLPGPDESTDRTEDTLDEESFSHGDYKFRRLAKQFSEDQIRYLQSCPVILRVGDIAGMGEVMVVHAGLVPGVPLEKQDPYQCMNMRSIDLETRLPSEDRDGFPWEKFWNHQQEKLPAKERKTVIYGHHAKRGMNILKYSKGLDSGCVNGGKLTAFVIEAGKKGKDAKTSVVSVKCKTMGYK